MKIENSQGQVFYGMHFYPGVAEYEDAKGAFRVFINEDTIRKMSPSFAGRPVFVDHVHEVDENLNQLRNEADGWVIESFFNSADGKTWAKFIVVTDRGLEAIKRGYKLSNAYIPELDNNGAVWNGVSYQKQVVGGEFEHLAIVRSPRYEESVIMSPDKFKAYNENLNVELKRLANSKEKKGDSVMSKFNIFKRTKVENSLDLEGMVVELPKSKKEISLTKLINDHDTILNMNGYANGDSMVKVGEKDEMSVNDLVKKCMNLSKEMEEMKSKNAESGEGEPGEDEDVENKEDEVIEEGEKAVGDRGGDEAVDEKLEKKSDKTAKDPSKKYLANTKAIALRNAHLNAKDNMETARIDLAEDQVARGKSRYGSK